jgi:putative ABC transport system permease protein
MPSGSRTRSKEWVIEMQLQLTLAARYLNGRKLRTLLTTLAVMFGVLVIFGMNIILPTLMAALQANVQGASGLVDFSATHITGEAFVQTVTDRLQGVDGVSAVSPSLTRTVNIPADFYDQSAAKADTITVLSLVGVCKTRMPTRRSSRAPSPTPSKWMWAAHSACPA